MCSDSSIGPIADRFLKAFRERLAKFGLELHPDKTRRIEFGRFVEQDRRRRGEGKPETFDFLGFTHISGKDGNGNFEAVKQFGRLKGCCNNVSRTLFRLDHLSYTGGGLLAYDILASML
jgi:RNA-directed DNA polymerase